MSYHLGRIGWYLDWSPPGGAIVFGRLELGTGAGVVSDFGVETWSVEGLVVGKPLIILKQDSIPYSNVYSWLTSALMNLGLLR